MLHVIYIVLTLVMAVYVVRGLYSEIDWRKQAGYALLLIPLLLRVFHIK